MANDKTPILLEYVFENYKQVKGESEKMIDVYVVLPLTITTFRNEVWVMEAT